MATKDADTSADSSDFPTDGLVFDASDINGATKYGVGIKITGDTPTAVGDYTDTITFSASLEEVTAKISFIQITNHDEIMMGESPVPTGITSVTKEQAEAFAATLPAGTKYIIFYAFEETNPIEESKCWTIDSEGNSYEHDFKSMERGIYGMELNIRKTHNCYFAFSNQ